jgi:hypothetical protein
MVLDYDFFLHLLEDYETDRNLEIAETDTTEK